MEFIVHMSLVCWWLARQLGRPWLHSLTCLRVGWLSDGASEVTQLCPICLLSLSPHKLGLLAGWHQKDKSKCTPRASLWEASAFIRLMMECQGAGALPCPQWALQKRMEKVWTRGGEELAHFCNLSHRLTRHSNEDISLPKAKTSHEMSASASATPSWLAQAFLESAKNMLWKSCSCVLKFQPISQFSVMTSTTGPHCNVYCVKAVIRMK